MSVASWSPRAAGVSPRVDSVAPRAAIERHSKSFALASRLLPARAARDAALLYAWCRRVDDAIDESDGGSSLEALERLRSELSSLYSGPEPAEPELTEIRKVLHTTGIPRQYPAELLAGMEMDVAQHRYHGCDELLWYCYRVAASVGLMMCHVLGVSSPAALRPAAHLGLAMQLTNVCRDVAEDWQRGRLYLPDELLRRHGAGGLARELGGPFPEAATGACRRAIRELLELAERYYASSDRGLEYLSLRSALAVNAARRIYSAIGPELARNGWDPRAPRAVVPRSRKLWLCARAALTTVQLSRRGKFRAAQLDTVLDGAELIPL